ncbi:hypothetical protein X798_04799 [Onchocerca flexuosa]|uniref:Uncharacterized protein n=1 Tax=Onchocerca flexuosa TaxID=387005 RepID=A0A238BSC1_9BILA|nr:hypothetical protein X798_04799 [Onchocerca flexuosa]
MAEQRQQQQEQQERINNQSRLPSDWFYSSVMLTNRLDIGERAGGIDSFQIDHLEQNDQSSLTRNNRTDPEFLHICQTTDASNNIYPSIITTASSSSSLSKLSFQTCHPEIPISHDNKIIENHDILIKRSNIDDCNFTVSSNLNFPTTNVSSTRNYNHTLQSQLQKKRNRRANMDQLRITSICNDDNNIESGRKNDNIQLERIEKVVEDSDGGDGARRPPNDVLYSHSTTNNSDKMKWDCGGVRWPSSAKRTRMLTSSYSVNIVDTHDNSGASDDGDGTTGTMDIAAGNMRMTERIAIDSKFGGSTDEMIQEKMEVITTTNAILDNDESKGITISKATMQLQNESNLTDSATMTTIGTTSSPSGQQQSSKIGLDEQSLSPTASMESLLLPSIKIPIKKRLIQNSLTSVPYNNSAKTTNTCTNISSNTYDTLSERHQLLPTTIASGATITSSATESAFSSCYQMVTTESTGTMISEDSVPPVTTYPKLLTGNDVYGNILNNHTVRTIPNSDPLPVANSLSEAEIVNLLCRNLCDIERIIAQQRTAYSGTSPIQVPSLLSQRSNGEQKSHIGYTGSVILPDNEQQQQQQQYRYHHTVTMERRRSSTLDSSDTRRFHPYATTTTTTATTTMITKIAPTTACSSNSITVWSPSVPSRADLKQKYLRSLAPVLYDLLTDDCESKNCQKTTDSMNCSIFKSCVEPSMDSYLRSLSLLAATASLPITNNKFDHLPFNYIDYFTLQQCSLLLGSAPVTSTDLLKLAQSANLLYSAAVTTPTTNPETALSDKIPFTSKIDQVN